MQYPKIRFWEQAPNHQSSKRLAFLLLIACIIILTTTFLMVTMDASNTVLLFAGLMAPTLTLVGLGKKQENDRAKIDNKIQ